MNQKFKDLFHKRKNTIDGVEIIDGSVLFVKDGHPYFYFSLTDEDDYDMIHLVVLTMVNEYRSKYNLPRIPFAPFE